MKKKIPKKEDILKTKEDAENIIVWLEELKKTKGWTVMKAYLGKQLEQRRKDLLTKSIQDIAELKLLRERITDLEDLINFPEDKIKDLRTKPFEEEFDVYE